MKKFETIEEQEEFENTLYSLDSVGEGYFLLTLHAIIICQIKNQKSCL
jgi:hypothetical protein